MSCIVTKFLKLRFTNKLWDWYKVLVLFLATSYGLNRIKKGAFCAVFNIFGGKDVELLNIWPWTAVNMLKQNFSVSLNDWAVPQFRQLDVVSYCRAGLSPSLFFFSIFPPWLLFYHCSVPIYHHLLRCGRALTRKHITTSLLFKLEASFLSLTDNPLWAIWLNCQNEVEVAALTLLLIVLLFCLWKSVCVSYRLNKNLDQKWLVLVAPHL